MNKKKKRKKEAKTWALVLIWSPFGSSSSPAVRENPERDIREKKRQSSLSHTISSSRVFIHTYNHSVRVQSDAVISSFQSLKSLRRRLGLKSSEEEHQAL